MDSDQTAASFRLVTCADHKLHVALRNADTVYCKKQTEYRPAGPLEQLTWCEDCHEAYFDRPFVISA